MQSATHRRLAELEQQIAPPSEWKTRLHRIARLFASLGLDTAEIHRRLAELEQQAPPPDLGHRLIVHWMLDDEKFTEGAAELSIDDVIQLYLDGWDVQMMDVIYEDWPADVAYDTPPTT